MLKANQTILVVVDIQGKLSRLVADREMLVKNVCGLIEGCQVLGVPAVYTEQIPEKMGSTDPEIEKKLAGVEPVEKNSFSCCGEPRFMDRLTALGRKQILLCGIEAHICVAQTGLDLLAEGYEVHLVTDAISSRESPQTELAVKRLSQAGTVLTSMEMALYELQKVAGGNTFKRILDIVKRATA